MSDAVRLALLDAAVWAAWSLVVGIGVHFVPAACFTSDSWLTRPRAFEHHGRVYERARVRRWKDRLPEAGALFTKDSSKRALSGRDRAALERFATETRRAEYVHALIPAIAPVFALWNPWWLTVAMLMYAVVANVPCIAIQRYNRARLSRVLAARHTRPKVDA